MGILRKIAQGFFVFILICVIFRVFQYFIYRASDGRALDLTDATVGIFGLFCAFTLYIYIKAVLKAKENRQKNLDSRDG